MKHSRWTMVDTIWVIQYATLPTILGVAASRTADRVFERQGVTVGLLGRAGIVACSALFGVVLAAIFWAIFVALVWVVSQIARFAHWIGRRR